MRRTAARIAMVLAVGAIVIATGTEAQTNDPLNTVERLRWPFDTARNWIVGLFSAAEADAESAMGELVQTLRRDIDRFQTLASEAGYSLDEIDVGATLIPSVSLIFTFQGHITQAERQALTAKLDGLSGVLGGIEGSILRGLVDLDRSVEVVRPDGFRLDQVQVDADIIPGFTFIFTPAGGG